MDTNNPLVTNALSRNKFETIHIFFHLNDNRQNCTIFLDNYFTSIPLLETLTANKLYCVGTVRSDRVEKAPLKDLKKENRDNTLYQTKGSCKRWSMKDKSAIQVDQPSLVHLYNKGMGGVDRFDQMRGLYRSRIRSKTWYWPLIRFCLDGSIVNMWYLYRQALLSRNESISLLEFRRRVVLALLAAPPSNSNTGPKPKLSCKVLSEVRYDGKEHWIDRQETQRRCGKCGKCTTFSCVKCNTGLHPDKCFRQYHQK
ncbi:unnamed protein product [Acanthoscelides obtectus]|uniref:PiggyBac transposable element-derived protein domain-containing protein n=1 Tax=Acanthoscelides obtectus TaxID=200917 RepID=A0A9P0P1K7_ACAOB|nr:unnamed protein product [Acanthoscelides obtectus]CAK1633195.1 PiggyBac transposable element-derived protein 3 [Acanthoscelides obtectus]